MKKKTVSGRHTLLERLRNLVAQKSLQGGTGGSKKKAKQAAKKAQQAKWASSSEEEDKKGEGEAQHDTSGAPLVRFAVKDDVWEFQETSKKSKKKKKAKNNSPIQRAQELSETELKEINAPALGSEDLFVDRVEDAKPDDEWDGFTAAKKKKKGRKVRRDEEREEEEMAEVEDDDTDDDLGWIG